MRILLLSAYDAASHKIWRQRLASLFPEHDWQQLSLPPRHFNWRIRANSLEWGLGEYPQLERQYDLLIATTMVDLASLRGFRPALSSIPTLLYCHENQFCYPENPDRQSQQRDNIEPKLVPVYSALCADKLIFNSEFNRRSFLRGTRELFEKLPDALPPGAERRLETSIVLPVPVSTDYSPPATRPGKAVLDVIWNHRWEYDKDPELLLEIVKQLVEQQAAIRLHVCGQSFRSQPKAFTELQPLCQQLTAQQGLDAGHWGYIESRSDYEQLLQKCDVVLSTARHDFQGLAIQEACLAGCTALAPADLAYPEYLPPECLFDRKADSQASAAVVVSRLLQWQSRRQAGHSLPTADLSAYCGETIRAAYEKVFAQVNSASRD